MSDVWFNRSCRLFHKNGHQWEYVDWVAVQRIMWNREKQRIILSGILPGCVSLLHSFPDGATLEIQHGCAGGPKVYIDGDSIMRFSNCIAKSKWIPDATILRPDLSETMSMYLVLSCEIEILGLDDG